MFPARAGMSPQTLPVRWILRRVPRASGDEPVMRPGFDKETVCSPRERG